MRLHRFCHRRWRNKTVKEKPVGFRKRIPGKPLRTGDWAGHIAVNVYDKEGKRRAKEIWTYEEDVVTARGGIKYKLLELKDEEDMEEAPAAE